MLDSYSMPKYAYSSVNELLAYLFDDQPHLLAQPIEKWLESSRRFTAFIFTFRDKIRKKLRVTRDEETLYDLQLELETAYLLLRERSLSVAYEPEQSKQIRSPDFAVTFTTSHTFMVEVTRLRALPSGDKNPAVPPDGERLADAICSKLGQLLPQRSNVLIIGTSGPRLTVENLTSVILQLQQRVERNDVAIVQRYRFRDRADFFNHYGRLSQVLVRKAEVLEQEPLRVWVNPQAKHPLPVSVQTALHRSHAV